MLNHWVFQEAVISTGNRPYTEELVSDGMIRTFDSNVDHEELVWHRDKKDRAVVVLESNG